MTIYRIRRTMASGGVTYLDVTEAGRVYTDLSTARTVVQERNARNDGSTYTLAAYASDPSDPPIGG